MEETALKKWYNSVCLSGAQLSSRKRQYYTIRNGHLYSSVSTVCQLNESDMDWTCSGDGKGNKMYRILLQVLET
jgi:hypothetical protein